MHRLIGGTWLRAKWIDRFDHSQLTYRAEIVSQDDPFYQAAMRTLDGFIAQCRGAGSSALAPESSDMRDTLKGLPLKSHAELLAEARRFHDILRIRDIPVETPELAFDHYHAVPVKVQDGCGGPCTFCSLYDRRIRIVPAEAVRRQIDLMADYLGEELDHFRKLVLLEGDALTVPSAELARTLSYARERFELEADAFAHAFAKAATVAKIPENELVELRNTGLLNVNFGLESGCQDLLDRVKRGQRLSEFYRAVTKLRDAGIDLSVNIIGGLGGAAFRDRHVKETVEFVRSLPAGTAVFYSRLHVPADSHYAKKQVAEFGGTLPADEVDRQVAVFEGELGASEYLFVPM